MSRASASRRELTALARLYGVQTSYEDVGGVRRHATPEALFLTLRALGAPLAAPAAAGEALRAARARLEARVTDPVHVAWGGRLAALHLRVPVRAARTPARLTLRLDSGETRTWRAPFEPAARGALAGYRLPVSGPLPTGYHELEIETRRQTVRTRILSAPRHMHAPMAEISWGAFAPLHALRTAPDEGIADYGDLARLARWIGSLGGRWIGTLPLLPAFVDQPFEPSPYSPVSRLFWNELYVAPGSLPHGRGAPIAAGPAASPELVDYRAAGRRRRDRVQAAAAWFFRAAEPAERAELEQFIAARPRLLDYARFRAACDRRGTGWHSWPSPMRAGHLVPGDFAPEDEDYYLYAQWQAERQLAAIGTGARSGGAALYLDLPLGVNPDGYDAWRFRDVFVEGASAGAPPDALFTGGQDWGFRPLHPTRLRETGYAYLIESLRHHLRHARMLRLDHVMWLFRLYWIPAGLSARDGVYVQYPADELFAVLAIEAVRHRARIVGEDLGTVPRAVRTAMERRRVQRIYVVQYELQPDAPELLGAVPRNAVASINTHDMPTFAGFLRGTDIDDQLDLGLIDAAGAQESRARRADLIAQLAEHFDAAPEPAALLRALLMHLAVSDARTVLVNLEDLWLETEPQNVPGTSGERPNWRRRFERTLSQIESDAQLAVLLGELDALRRAPLAATITE
ncbi:MAG TPA: 4-alpha-glucanotransferase [Longimicrobiales bacterium]|nr:4-alpha-glucanotransferase [Longimicrobiales bacterium]